MRAHTSSLDGIIDLVVQTVVLKIEAQQFGSQPDVRDPIADAGTNSTDGIGQHRILANGTRPLQSSAIAQAVVVITTGKIALAHWSSATDE